VQEEVDLAARARQEDQQVLLVQLPRGHDQLVAELTLDPRLYALGQRLERGAQRARAIEPLDLQHRRGVDQEERERALTRAAATSPAAQRGRSAAVERKMRSPSPARRPCSRSLGHPERNCFPRG
jgi:hypothetical protein